MVDNGKFRESPWKNRPKRRSDGVRNHITQTELSEMFKGKNILSAKIFVKVSE